MLRVNAKYRTLLNKLSVNKIIAISACTAVLGLQTVTNAQMAPPPQKDIDLNIDSGIIYNNTNEQMVVWSTIVDIPEAGWIQLKFEVADLTRSLDADGNSIIRLTSIYDFATQHQNWITVNQWQNHSAYFNGNAVAVELIAAPGDQPNHIIISGAKYGIVDEEQGISTICGPTDDRQLSEYARSARLMSVGCTTWLIDDAHHQFLTAGHCRAFGGLDVAEFNVPMSNSGGTIVHPGPEDQYAADPASIQYTYVTIGDDWCYFGCFPNTETGLTAYQAQGDFYTLADSAPPVNGQDIRITGYGTVSYPVPPEWNQVQKTHVGPYYYMGGTTVQYKTDTSGGNSGSAVFNDTDGTAIGIHTHGGCDSGGGANSGTAIHHSGLQNALANPKGVCAPFNLDVSTLSGGQNGTLTATDATPGNKVYFIYSLKGDGSTLLKQLGVTLSLANPKLGGSDVADFTGTAQIKPYVPSAASGKTIWIQAAENGRVSVVVKSVVN